MHSRATVVVPLHDCIIFVGTLDGAELVRWFSEIAQTLDAVPGKSIYRHKIKSGVHPMERRTAIDVSHMIRTRLTHFTERRSDRHSAWRSENLSREHSVSD